MIPVAAPIGRPSAGRSTLSNRLTCTRGALAVDFPGPIRDRKYGRAEVEGREFICIDTGGIDSTEEGVEIRVAEQSLLAIEEVDVVLFMVDARAGLMPANIVIVKHLYSRERPTLLMVNRTDDIDIDQAMADFWSLGLGDIYPIATSYGHGVTNLLGQALLPWVDEINPQEEMDEDAEYWAKLEAEQNDEAEKGPEDDFNPQGLPIKLAIAGHPNVGKSTLTNRIPDEDRVVVYDMPGTTRDSIYIPMQCDKHEYVLTDTTEIRKRRKITDIVEKFSMIKIPQAVKDASIVLLVIDAREKISDQGPLLLGFILNGGRSLMIVVDKRDGLNQEMKEQVKETLGYRLGFVDFARAHFIFALHGNDVSNLFESVREAYDSATRRVSTAMLTRITNVTVENHQPPLVRSRRVKLKYAHARDYSPPIAVIHGNQAKDPSDSYKRHLMNYFRKSLNVMGTPVRVQFERGENPFTNRRNTLTPNWMRKRKHSIKYIEKSR